MRTTDSPIFEGFDAAVDFARALLPHTEHAGAFVFDADYVVSYADGVVLRDRGYAPTVVTGRRAGDVLTAGVWKRLKGLCDRTLAGEAFVVAHEGLNGRMYRMHGSPVLGPGGAVIGGLLVSHEAVSPAEERLAHRLRQHAAIAELGRMALSHERDLRDLIRAAVQFVVVTLPGVDAAGVAELLPGGERFRAHEMGSALRSTEFAVSGSLLERVLEAQVPLVLVDDGACRFPPHLREGGFVTVGIVPIGPPDAPFGALAAFARHVRAFSDDDLHFLAAIGNVVAEAVRHEQADAEFRRNAMHDAVTGLPNRQLLEDRLEQSLTLARRSGLRVGVYFVDLDRFKIVNDSLGHHAGDEVLRVVARRLHSALRVSDTVARFGGDEFVIVAPSLESEDDAVQLARTVLAALDAPIMVGERPLHMRASVGVTLTSPDAEADPRMLLRNADAAMYRAKARGHHRYELHDPARTEQVDALKLEQALRDALAAGELRLAFQPFVRFDDGAARGAEVLLRWEHPARGLIGPGVFLDVAEQTGLIVPIGEWMLKEACRLAAGWDTADDFLLTINLSATQLADPGIVEAVRIALQDTGLAPGRLGLELTEQVLVGDVEMTLRTLGDLKQLGVKLLLDDFGTGYSSLSHLKRFPIDIVKIDRSFIDGVGTGGIAGDAAIVSAIVGMSWATGKQVIPEGIETADQVEALRRMGCSVGQGYFFAKPAPADAFEAWLKRSPAADTPAGAAPAAATASLVSGLSANALSVLERLERQLPEDAAVWVGHLDYAMDALRVLAAAGDASFGLATGLEAPIEQSLCHMLAAGGGPELCGHAGDSPYAELDVQRSLAIGSFVGQPIVADGRIVGTVCAISHRENAFTEQHREWLAMGALVLTAGLQATGRGESDLDHRLRRAAFEARSAHVAAAGSAAPSGERASR
jgi:diguanylate cyclase (GGDEF)-like protein